MGWIIGLLAFFGFLFFLFKFPKQTLGSVGVVIGIAALLFYATIVKPDNDRKRLNEHVVVTVSYNESTCSKEYPLAIFIQNGSNKTISKVWWDINVYRSGYSTDISGYSNDYSSDKILKPGESWSACYIVPTTLDKENNDLSKFEYKISDKHASFE
jgi:hypothetical protein